MTVKKRTEITIETERVVVIGSRPATSRAWCRACARPSVWVTVDEAATIAGIGSRAIYRRVEAGTLHSAETPDGHLRVCLNSIAPPGLSNPTEIEP